MSHNETLTLTASAINAAINARALEAVIGYRASSTNLVESFRVFASERSGKDWEVLREVRTDLVASTVAFLDVAMTNFADDTKSIDLDRRTWERLCSTIADALTRSCLSGVKIQGRYRADHDKPLGKRAVKSGEVLGYNVTSRPTSNGKSRWIEYQINLSDSKQKDALDANPVVDLDSAPIDSEVSEQDHKIAELTRELIDARAKLSEPVIRLDAEREQRLMQGMADRDNRIEQLGLDLALASADLADTRVMLDIVRRERDELLQARSVLLARIAAMHAMRAPKTAARKTKTKTA